GSLALAGIFPFAGFYSKDMILTTAYATGHRALFVIGLVTAFMTAFYMMRACALTFMGEPRERDRFAHAHESPWSMTLPLWILAFLSLVVGKFFVHDEFVQHLFAWPHTPEIAESHFVTALATGSALLGILLGW